MNREALSLLPMDHEDRPLSLCNLAIALHTWSQHTGSFDNIVELIALQQEGLSISAGHARYLHFLTALAISFGAWFCQKSDIADFEESVWLYQEALILCPPGHPDRLWSLNNVATTLQD